MATIHITEAEAMKDVPAIFAQVREGDVVIVDGGPNPIVIQTASPKPKTLREMLASLPNDSPDVDEDFARDVAEANARFNEPFNPPEWD